MSSFSEIKTLISSISGINGDFVVDSIIELSKEYVTSSVPKETAITELNTEITILLSVLNKNIAGKLIAKIVGKAIQFVTDNALSDLYAAVTVVTGTETVTVDPVPNG